MNECARCKKCFTDEQWECGEVHLYAVSHRFVCPDCAVEIVEEWLQGENL